MKQPPIPKIDAGVEKVCDEFEAAWRSRAERPSVRTYLYKVDSARQSVLFGSLLELDLYYRRQSGDSPRKEEYLAQFPEYGPLIEDTFGGETTTKEFERSKETEEVGELTLEYIVTSGQSIVSESPAYLQRRFSSGMLLSNRYRIVDLIGEGGMGTVLLGNDTRLDRNVAVKLICDRHWKSGHRKMMMAEFEGEARVGAKLEHPAIASVHDYGFHDSIPYISKAESRSYAQLKLQLYAATCGADAVVNRNFEKLVTADGTNWVAKGLVSRSLDSTTRDDFALRRYAKSSRWLGFAITALVCGVLALQLAICFPMLNLLESNRVSSISCFGIPLRVAPLIYAAPLILLALFVATTGWPQLLRALGIATATWTLFPLWVLAGIQIARINQLSGADEVWEMFSDIVRSRGGRRVGAAVGATGVAFAFQVYRSCSTPALLLKRRAPLHRKAAACMAWTLVLWAFAVPIWAIGWGLNVPGRIPFEDRPPHKLTLHECHQQSAIRAYRQRQLLKDSIERSKKGE